MIHKPRTSSWVDATIVITSETSLSDSPSSYNVVKMIGDNSEVFFNWESSIINLLMDFSYVIANVVVWTSQCHCNNPLLMPYKLFHWSLGEHIADF